MKTFRKIRFIIIVFIASISFCKAQSSSYSTLKVGDMMPSISLEQMYNYPGGKANTADFSDKLLIIDLWNSMCTPCIKGFPHMEELQKKYREKIQVLLVNPMDTKEGLLRLGFPDKTKSNIVNTTKLPFALEEFEFLDLFPVNGMPYQIWVYKGKIIGLTVGKGVNAELIDDILSGKEFPNISTISMEELYLPYPEDNSEYYSMLQLKSKPLATRISYSFIIAHSMGAKGFGRYLQDSTSEKYVGLRNEGTLINLLGSCVSNFNTLQNYDRVVLEVDNPEDFCYPLLTPEKINQWRDKNVYAIEIKLPASRMTGDVQKDILTIQKQLLHELENYFNVKVSVEKRMVTCRALVRISDQDKLKTAGGEVFHTENGSLHSQTDPKKSKGIFSVTNGNLSSLFAPIRRSLYYSPIKPFLNETGFPLDKKIDIDINVSMGDLPALRSELKKYGLDIIEVKRELEVFVIKQNR